LRLNEIISLQNKLSAKSKKTDIGKIQKVLIEGTSKRSPDQFYGRNSQNKVVVFPRGVSEKREYVMVLIGKSTSATLIGSII
jgi:tRNA-2-methylthio-N6-dimethylallyladenosine synthase